MLASVLSQALLVYNPRKTETGNLHGKLKIFCKLVRFAVITDRLDPATWGRTFWYHPLCTIYTTVLSISLWTPWIFVRERWRGVWYSSATQSHGKQSSGEQLEFPCLCIACSMLSHTYSRDSKWSEIDSTLTTRLPRVQMNCEWKGCSLWGEGGGTLNQCRSCV